jgi:hypothetical protein
MPTTDCEVRYQVEIVPRCGTESVALFGVAIKHIDIQSFAYVSPNAVRRKSRWRKFQWIHDMVSKGFNEPVVLVNQAAKCVSERQIVFESRQGVVEDRAKERPTGYGYGLISFSDGILHLGQVF